MAASATKVPSEIAYKIEKSALIQLKAWADAGEAVVPVASFKERMMAHFRTPILSKQPGLGATNALKLKPTELEYVGASVSNEAMVALATRGGEWAEADGALRQPEVEDEAVGEVDLGDDFASGGDY